MSTTATIDLSAVAHNFHEVKRLQPQAKILSMIKANAYGHGSIAVAKTLENSDAFGAATLKEALQLKAAGINKDIVVMRGFLNQEELAVFLDHPSFIAGIHDASQLTLLNEYASKKLRIWLKLDTGMNRLGFQPEHFSDAYTHLKNIKNIDQHFVIYSHLADADNSDPSFTKKQIQCFDALTKQYSNPKSLLNSSGILVHGDAKYDWVRPGIMLYGGIPFKNRRAAMIFESTITAVKKVKKGETIGYSCIFTAKNDMTVAIVGVGYGDGYPRHAKNGTPVLIHGQRCPLVGRVSMDMITVDVSQLNHVSVGDPVILWNETLPADEVAKHADTISYELFC